MDKSSATTAVKIIAILYWVGAALGIITGIAMIFGGSFLLSFPIGTIIGIAIIYLLVFEKTVKSLFN